MPLFGFRTHKKYDKDFSQEKQIKGAPDKVAQKVKSSKDIKGTKESAIASKTQAVAAVKPTVMAIPSGISSSVTEAILRPRVTEKSGIMSQNGAYTFQVAKNANKQTVARAITTMYKVHPVKIAMINTPSRNTFTRGRKGQVPGIRKAIVTVKKGEKIDFV